MNLSLKMYGTPILREKAVEVTLFNSDLKTLADEMFKIMYEARGIGLAAEQIGRKRKNVCY